MTDEINVEKHIDVLDGVRAVAMIFVVWFHFWQQYIAVEMKLLRIPYWEGDTPPNMTGDRVWMWKYQILIIVVSLVVAVVMTYAFERPVSKWLLRCKKKECFDKEVVEENVVSDQELL